jgi:sugar/nucleoside kinase (ribokinase family)
MIAESVREPAQETAMILAVGEALMELRRVETRGELATPGNWRGPFCSGAPAIFASVAARLGAPTILAVAVGDDPFGRHLTARLHHDGVGGQALSTSAGRATALAMVAYDAVGERDFFFSVRGSAAEAIDIAAAVDAARGATWIHVSGSSVGFGDPLASAVESTVAAGLRAGARLSLDPNLRPDAPSEALKRTAALARQASLLFPSAGELTALALEPADLAGRGALICTTNGPGGAELRGPGIDGPITLGTRRRGGRRHGRRRFIRRSLPRGARVRRPAQARRDHRVRHRRAMRNGDGRHGSRDPTARPFRPSVVSR